MSLNPANGKSCLLAAGLLLLVLLLIAAALLIPWGLKMQFYGQETVRLTEHLQRFERVNARRPVLERRLKETTQLLQKSNQYIRAATPALAAAERQKRVKTVIESSGGTLVSTQNISREAVTGKPQQITIKTRMRSDTEALVEVLYTLEGGRPLLFIDNLSIQSYRRVQRRGRERLTISSLDVQFELTGYLRGGG